MHNQLVPRRWLGYTEAAAYLGVTKRQLERLVHARRIGFTRLGRNTVFTTEQLDAYIAAQTFTPGHDRG